MKKNIYVMVGIPASGKTTYANILMDKFSGFKLKYLNADYIRKRLYGDPSIQGDGKRVFGVLFNEYTEVLKDDSTVLIIIDNTSIDAKNRKRYYDLAHSICPMFDNTFEYNLVIFEPNLERAKEWNKKRDRVVPEDVLDRMFGNFEYPTAEEEKRAIITYID
jgi:predicted kinase